MSDQNTHSSSNSHDQAADPDEECNIKVEPDLDTDLAPCPTHSLHTIQNTDVSSQGPVHDTDYEAQPSNFIEPYFGPYFSLGDTGDYRPAPFKQSTSHHLHFKYSIIPNDNNIPAREPQGSSSIPNDNNTSTIETQGSTNVGSSSEKEGSDEDLDGAALEDAEAVAANNTRNEKDNYNGRPDHIHPLDVRWTCSVCVKLERDVEEIRSQPLVNEFELRYARQRLIHHHRDHGLV